MTALRRRMLEDMPVRNLSAGTQQVYLEHISRFARHFDRSPVVLGPEEIRAYQLCRRSAWRPDRLGTCPLRSGKRSRS